MDIGFAPSPSGLTSPTILNLSAASLRKWTAGRSRALVGAGQAYVNFVSDSTIWKGSGTGGNLTAGGQPKTMVASLVKLLNGWAGRSDFARSDGFWGSHNSLFAVDLTEFVAFDTRWTLGAGWTVGTSARLGGVNLRIPAANTAASTYQTTLPYDRVRFVYPRFSSNTTTLTVTSASGGTGTVTFANISGGGANGGDLQSVTINLTRGTGLLTITPSGGSTASDLVVVELYDSTTGQVILREMPASGSQADQWVTQCPIALAQVPADLSFYNFTLNDANAGILPDAFETNMRALIALGSPGSVVLGIENESITGTFGGLPAQRALADRLRTMSAVSAYPAIDLPARWGDYVAANNNGMMGDTGHPNATGYAEKAAAMLQVLTA